MTFNEKIDKYMKENNISNLKQLSNMANIPYTTMRDFYEKKSADNSRLSTIRKLSKYMKCSMDYLAYDDIEELDEIKINGYDLSDDENTESNIFKTKISLKEPASKMEPLFNFLTQNSLNYEVIKGNEKNNDNQKLDEIEILFANNKDVLTEDDKEYIKFIIEKRRKEIDKELENEKM